jgi:hypothetical protein
MDAATPMELDMSRTAMLLAGVLLLPALAGAELHVVIVEGLGGEGRYAEQFAEQVSAFERAADALTSADNIKVFHSADFSRDSVIEYFGALGSRMRGDDQLALLLIGHGSYDEHEYKFNIAGPDLTGTDLIDMLDATKNSTQLLVNTGSASGAMYERLKADNRTLILATRSGAERHATRFGHYFAAALADSTADIDKNRIITAEEAFRFAERQVQDFYERNGQLATEHPRMEGAQAGRFSLARLGATRPARSDAELERLTRMRDELNAGIESLRLRRDSMSPDAYQADLLESMLELATLEEEIEKREGKLADEN